MNPDLLATSGGLAMGLVGVAYSVARAIRQNRAEDMQVRIDGLKALVDQQEADLGRCRARRRELEMEVEAMAAKLAHLGGGKGA